MIDALKALATEWRKEAAHYERAETRSRNAGDPSSAARFVGHSRTYNACAGDLDKVIAQAPAPRGDHAKLIAKALKTADNLGNVYYSNGRLADLLRRLTAALSEPSR